jgi:N-carbamoylputrescine amidase
MIVACIQMNPVIGDKPTNVSRSADLIRSAAERGVDLVVLPELANTGYVFRDRQEALDLAEKVPGGETTAVWSELASRHQTTIVAGIAERDGDNLFNSAVMVGPKGLYRALSEGSSVG